MMRGNKEKVENDERQQERSLNVFKREKLEVHI
jgi:hypothetical protein